MRNIVEQQQHDLLVEKIAELRQHVSDYGTAALVNYLATARLLRSDTRVNEFGLTSPHKQFAYLLGLMLSVAEPIDALPFDKPDMVICCELLEAIFMVYGHMYDDNKSRVDTRTPDAATVQVAMSTFFHYFFSPGLLASVEQYEDIIHGVLAPFDTELLGPCGVTATQAIEMSRWICNKLQTNVDTMTEGFGTLMQSYQEYIKEVEAKKLTSEQALAKAQVDVHTQQAGEALAVMNELFVVTLDELQDQFGDRQASAFWQSFVAERGKYEGFTYPTERNPAEFHPLFATESGVAVCPFADSLLPAILDGFSEKLYQSPYRDRLLKQRDKHLEAHTERVLHAFFGESANYYSNVFETPKSQFEHDLLITWQRCLFVIEAKARPLKEPFRDPEQAYTRLKRDFQSDGGIQKGYEQAHRIRQKWNAGEVIELFDSKGAPVVRITSSDIDAVYCIIVTADNFSQIAIDLSLLLEKLAEDDYPWAINVVDLDTLLEGFRYRNWGPEYLLKYLDERKLLHGKVCSTDELELGGVFLNHGTLQVIMNEVAKGTLVVMGPDSSDIFDQIWTERMGGPKAVFGKSPLVMNDMRELMARTKKESTTQIPSFNVGTLSAYSRSDSATPQKIGRNEPCYCGSGIKYKRCHGK